VTKKARSTKSRSKAAKKGDISRQQVSPKRKKKTTKAKITKKRVGKTTPEAVKSKRAVKQKVKKAAKSKAVKRKVVKRGARGRPVAPPTAGLKKSKRGGAEKVKRKERATIPFPSPAITAFGKAVNFFNRHNFEKAREAFESFVERFPEESEMVARARTYVAICHQRLARPPSPPRNAEALYNQGVYELNRGRIEQAISYFERALKAQPEADHVLYSLAAAHARLGQVTQALEELKQAIGRREVYRIQARRDPDFTLLYSHPIFQELVGWEVVEGSGINL